MKKAEEYIKGYSQYFNNNAVTRGLIKQVQIDAIDEAVNMCAEKAKLEYSYKPITSTTTKQPDILNAWINKQSILNVANKLKSKL